MTGNVPRVGPKNTMSIVERAGRLGKRGRYGKRGALTEGGQWSTRSRGKTGEKSQINKNDSYDGKVESNRSRHLLEKIGNLQGKQIVGHTCGATCAVEINFKR